MPVIVELPLTLIGCATVGGVLDTTGPIKLLAVMSRRDSSCSLRKARGRITVDLRTRVRFARPDIGARPLGAESGCPLNEFANALRVRLDRRSRSSIDRPISVERWQKNPRSRSGSWQMATQKGQRITDVRSLKALRTSELTAACLRDRQRDGRAMTVRFC